MIELYAFKGVRSIIPTISNELFRNVVYYGYIVISVVAIIMLVIALSNFDRGMDPAGYPQAYLFLSLIFMIIVPKLVFTIFHLFDDIIYLFRWILLKLSGPTEVVGSNGNEISRFTFLTQLGAWFGLFIFGSMIYGIFKGKYDFRVIKQKLSFSNLPNAFNGLKVVQISDAHLGSFEKGHPSVSKAIDMVNALEPDIIMFTGDLVNNYAVEAEAWVEEFAKLKAKIGKFSILGNHDYSDYVNWNSIEDKNANLRQLVMHHRNMGFELLMNQNIRVNKAGESIIIAGVENWGKPPFVQYGDLSKAMNGISDEEFTILLSHDPSHWDEQITSQTEADLTLSGHTHGMQFGIEIPGIKWSPVKYKYPKWAGLYQQGKQYLYVNRGFGFIGFSGRVGIAPEITLFELEKA